MKKITRIVALAGLIGLAATSCTKENVTDTVNVSNVSTVYYTMSRRWSCGVLGSRLLRGAFPSDCSTLSLKALHLLVEPPYC